MANDLDDMMQMVKDDDLIEEKKNGIRQTLNVFQVFLRAGFKILDALVGDIANGTA
jgi:hypothetical protein